MKKLTEEMLAYLKNNNLKTFNEENIIYLCETHWGNELISISHSVEAERTPFGVVPVDVISFKTDIREKSLSQVAINHYNIEYDKKKRKHQETSKQG